MTEKIPMVEVDVSQFISQTLKDKIIIEYAPFLPTYPSNIMHYNYYATEIMWTITLIV